MNVITDLMNELWELKKLLGNPNIKSYYNLVVMNESVFESIEKCPHYKKDFIENNRTQCAEREYKQSIDWSEFYFELYLLQRYYKARD